VFTDYSVPLAFLVFLCDHKLFYLFYIVILIILIKRSKVENAANCVQKPEKFSAGMQDGLEDLTPGSSIFRYVACQVLPRRGFELMSSCSGARLSTKELASHLRLSGCQEDFLQSSTERQEISPQGHQCRRPDPRIFHF
jgi:hypothetical protein